MQGPRIIMEPFVKDLYIALCAKPERAQEKAKMAVLVQEMLSAPENFEFVEKYIRKSGTYLYGEYMKQRTQNILSKLNTDGGILIQ